MSPHDEDDLRLIRELRDEVARLLADAVQVYEETRAESLRVHDVHDFEIVRLQGVHDAEVAAIVKAFDAETVRVQHLHDAEIAALQQLADDQAVNLVKAIASRDVIGQAKGITMVAMHCTAEQAYGLLKTQSQAQNRKLVEIATEIAETVSRRAKPI